VLSFMKWRQPRSRFAATPLVVFDAILNREPVAHRLLNSSVPAKLDEMIRRALEKDRNLRFQHASHLPAELQCLRRGSSSGRSQIVPVVSSDPSLPQAPPPSSSVSNGGPKKSKNKLIIAAAEAAVSAAALALSLHKPGAPSAPPARKEWEQLNFFTGSAVCSWFKRTIAAKSFLANWFHLMAQRHRARSGRRSFRAWGLPGPPTGKGCMSH
jgi:hypothetical protein